LARHTRHLGWNREGFGKGQCRMCGLEVRGRRETSCSQYCVDLYMRLSKAATALGTRDLDICQGCGGRGHEVDHILAVNDNGGCSSTWNMRLLCTKCHVDMRKRMPAPTVLAPMPDFLRHSHPRYIRRLAEADRENYYRMGPMFSRARRVQSAVIDYRREPNREEFAQRLFWEVEALQEHLLILHRCIEYRPLEVCWMWCHEVLSYLHDLHGYRLQIPLHLPLL